MIRDIRARFVGSNLPLLVLTAGLLLSAVTAYFSVDSINSSATNRFERINSEIIDTVSTRLRTYQNAITQLRGLLQVLPNIDRQAYRTYTQNINLPVSYPGLMGVGFVEIVPPKTVQRFEATVRRENQNPHLTIWPQPPPELKNLNQPLYVVRFFEPEMQQVNGRNLIGYDVLSEEQRRSAFEKARDTGQTVLSKPLHLILNSDGKAQDYILVTAIYKANLPMETIAQRKAGLIGFVTAAFRAQDLFNEIFDRAHLDLEGLKRVRFQSTD